MRIFRIGKSVLAAFPSEIFAQTGLDLKKMAFAINLAIVSCANGYIGHVPPQSECARGGMKLKAYHGFLRIAFRQACRLSVTVLYGV